MSPDFLVEHLSSTAHAAHLRASVPRDLIYFEGHFEGRPMLPGIAQLLVLVQRRAREVFGPLGRERAMQRVKFEAVIGPGDVLDVHLERILSEGEARVRFRIERAGRSCASGTILYAVGA